MVYNSSGYEKEKDKEVQSVLKFIYGLGPNSDFTDNLKQKVNELKQKKNLKEGYMRLYDVIEEEKEEAAKQAALQTSITAAKDMIKDGKLSNEDISKYSRLPLDQVNALAKELTEKSE